MAFKLFDYQSAGKGVSKNGPQKKPFFKFFEIFGNKFWKIIELNLIFVLFCIPIVTFGPAMAALTHVMRKFVLEQPCFVFDEFVNAFKKNFKQSVGIGIFDLAAMVGFVFTVWQYFSKKHPDSSLTTLVFFVIVVSTLLFMMHFYVYLEITALDLSMSAILKNALLLVFLGVKNNFLTLVINLFFITVVVLFIPFSLPVLIVLPISIMCFATVFICYPVIQKFIVNPYYESRGEKNPELQYDSEEEAVFVDRGGQEPEIKSVTKAHGKVIK